MGTCLASVGTVDPLSSAGLHQKVAKTGQKGPKLTVSTGIQISRFWPILTGFGHYLRHSSGRWRVHEAHRSQTSPQSGIEAVTNLLWGQKIQKIPKNRKRVF